MKSKLKCFIVLFFISVPLMASSNARISKALHAVVDFIAPSFQNTDNITNAGTGAIVYDQSRGNFRGLGGDGIWQDMSTSSTAPTWLIDANIEASGNITLSDTGTDSQIIDSGLDMVQNAISATAEIACATGNPGFPDCGGTSEAIGVAFTPPTTGIFRACLTYTHSINAASSDHTSTTFRLKKTAANDSTSGVVSGNVDIRSGTSSASYSSNHATPIELCSNFSLVGGTKVAVRLFYIQDSLGTFNNQLIADVNGGIGNLHWTVYKLQ